jgi:hypothetical protein
MNARSELITNLVCTELIFYTRNMDVFWNKKIVYAVCLYLPAFVEVAGLLEEILG